MTEKDCILWPVRFDSTSYFLKITEVSSTFTKTMLVTADRNYWLSGDGQADASTNNGTGDLVAMLETTLDGIFPGRFVVTVTEDGRLSVLNTVNSAWAINWSDAATTLDPALFGFTGSDASTTTSTITAPHQTRGIWYSGLTRSTDSRDRQPVLGAVALTMSGLSRISNLSAPRKTRSLSWSLVPQSRALAEYASAIEPTGAFESAWLDALAVGFEFRVYDVAATRTGSSFSLYRTLDIVDPIEPSAAPVRFDVSLRCVRAD